MVCSLGSLFLFNVLSGHAPKNMKHWSWRFNNLRPRVHFRVGYASDQMLDPRLLVARRGIGMTHLGGRYNQDAGGNRPESSIISCTKGHLDAIITPNQVGSTFTTITFNKVIVCTSRIQESGSSKKGSKEANTIQTSFLSLVVNTDVHFTHSWFEFA